MISIFVLALIITAILVVLTLTSYNMYKKALELNPKQKELERIEAEILVAQNTLDLSKAEFERLEAEKVDARAVIRSRESAEKYLREHEEEMKEKKLESQTIEEEIHEASLKLEQVKTSIEELQKEKQEIKEDFDNLSSLHIKVKGEVDELQEKKNRIEKELVELEASISSKKQEENLLTEKILELKKERDDLLNQVRELERKKEELTRSIEILTKRNDELIKQNSELIAINKIQEEKETEARIRKIDSADKWTDLDQPINVIKTTKGEKIDELNWLNDFHQKLENNGLYFDKRTIYAFHTGLKVQDISPLVVLAGISGTGKSLLPKLYSQAIGMNFLSIAVQPRWDSPQDMLGFYNYMQDRYKATEFSKMLWQFDFYNNNNVKEKYRSEGELPMNLVLLDEMNLARVEYYFSDLLSKLEIRRTVKNKNDKISREPAEIEIECGSLGKEENSRRLFVNNNILFVGTMNEDETTQMLSDKVVDRSNMLRFGKPKNMNVQRVADIQGFSENYPADQGVISFKQWNDLKKQTSNNPKDDHDLSVFLNEINDQLNLVGRPFAYRIEQSIHNYVANYPSIKGNGFRDAVSDQVEMKIIPKLNGLDKTDTRVKGVLGEIKKILDKNKLDQELISTYSTVCDNQNNMFFQWKGIER